MMRLKSCKQISVWLLLFPLRSSGAYRIRIGTRASPLAVGQAEAVGKALVRTDASVRPQIIKMKAPGDREDGGIQNVPLAFQSVDFTGTLDRALLSGEIDVAVHSLKDVPPSHRWQCHGSGVSLFCLLPREDPADALVGPYRTLSSLPAGSKVGTSSVRRQSQLLSTRGGDEDGVRVINVRGNLDARIGALQDGTVDALILALSGLKRLRIVHDDVPYTRIDPDEMLPGLCQGIVAVACFARTETEDDPNTARLVRLLRRAQDRDATIAATAERSFLDALDWSSPWKGRPPLAGLMQPSATTGDWSFRGLLARPDGKRVLHQSGVLSSDCSEQEAATLGASLGRDLLDRAGPHFFNEGPETI